MKKEIKILHLIPELNYTCGISKSILNLTLNIDKRFNMEIFTLDGDAVDYYDRLNIKVKCLHIDRKKIINILIIIKELILYIKKEKIDIVHSHHRIFDYLVFSINMFHKVNTVTTVHSIVKGWRKFSYKAEKIIAVSNAVKKNLQDYFKVDENKIVVINNFVIPTDLKSFVGNKQVPKQLSTKMDSKVLLFVGRFDKEKGVDILVNAFKNISSRFDEYKLVLLGEGNLKEWIIEFKNSNKLNISLADPTNEVSMFYNIADIVVLPSRVDPFPMTMLEAGLFKKAFIGSNVDGIGEFIENGKDGILVENENISELTNGLKKLLNDPKLCAEIGNNLYEKVTLYCTKSNIVPQYEHLYLSTVN